MNKTRISMLTSSEIKYHKKDKFLNAYTRGCKVGEEWLRYTEVFGLLFLRERGQGAGHGGVGFAGFAGGWMFIALRGEVGRSYVTFTEGVRIEEVERKGGMRGKGQGSEHTVRESCGGGEEKRQGLVPFAERPSGGSGVRLTEWSRMRQSGRTRGGVEFHLSNRRGNVHRMM